MDASPVVSVGAGTFLRELVALVDQMHSALLIHAERDAFGVEIVGAFFIFDTCGQEIEFNQ